MQEVFGSVFQHWTQLCLPPEQSDLGTIKAV